MPHPNVTASEFEAALAVCADAYSNDRTSEWEDEFLDDLMSQQGVDDINDLDYLSTTPGRIDKIVEISVDRS